MRHSKLLLPIIFILSLSSCGHNEGNPILKEARLTTPHIIKKSKEYKNDLSTSTYNSYISFYKKFSSLMMDINRKEDSNLAISIPDAYLCLAISGAISTDLARKDILDYLELSSYEDMKIAIKEILASLCTLYQNHDDKLVGGYNLNSIWLNPNKVELIKEKDVDLYHDLEDVFDASIYLKGLTSELATDYIKENGLKEMPIPEIKLDDGNPSAISVMSVYYCLDYFSNLEKDIYYNQFKSGNHKMDYYYKGNDKKVDYIERSEKQVVFDSDKLYGSKLDINYLDMSFYLPKDENSLPKDILMDVLNENYNLKQGKVYYFDEEYEDTNIFDVNIKAPYFSIDNKLDLNHGDIEQILPNISHSGAGERLAKSIFDNTLYLDNIKQFSKMKFDYDGFYSCSVTIASMEATAAPARYETFDLTLDRPYIFTVNRNLRIGSGTYKNIPLIIGEIINPEYE